MKDLLNKLRIYCPHCNGFSFSIRKRHRGTAYTDSHRNYIILCANCHEEELKYWEEQWKDYYSDVI